LIKKVHEAADFIKTKLDRPPEVAVITGTGLGNAVGPLDDETLIPYGRIPHFPVSTIASHPGRLIVGKLGNAPVMIMQGRVHLYEGYTPGQVTFPIRVMQVLGVRHLILSNASGGLNAAFQKGNLMVIRDHINLTGENPLMGPNNDDWGPRFPDMTSAYTPSLIRVARKEGDGLALPIVEGVYAGLKGPSLETPAEVRFLKTIGADAVGFSTVMETIAAAHGGLRVLGLSTITNTIDPDNPVPATLEEIVETANRTAPKLRRLIEGIIDRFPKEESK
jgi:purine-nucleoside phosphorylase